MRYLLLFTLLFSLGIACSSGDNASPLSEDKLESFTSKGAAMAANTQKVLGGNLISAIREDGPVYAMEFCNIQAQPLTDSMSVEMNAMIRRVTDQPRNPLNQATTEQLDHIRKLKNDLNQGNTLEPYAIQNGDKVIAYYPIITNSLCLQCHGDPETQINEKTLARIKEYYPDDKAIGYTEGQLRGIWVVTMDTSMLEP